METEKGPQFREGQSGQEDRRAIEKENVYGSLNDREKDRLEELQARPYRGRMLTRGDALEVIFLERRAEERIDQLIKQGMEPGEARRRVFEENGIEE
jgi:hypothetical protein